MKSEKKIFSNSFGFYFPWHIQLFGLILFVLGIIGTIETYGISLLASIGGLFLLATTYKIKIDFKKKWYKSTYALLNIDFSGWTELFPVKYVVVKKNQYTKTYSSRVNTMSIGETKFEVYLVFEDLDKIKVHSNKKLDSATEIADDIARQLSVEIRVRTKNIE